MRVRYRHVALAAATAAFLVALPAVRNGFVQDDEWIVGVRPLLHEAPSVGAVLRAPFWPKSFGGSMWRPALLATYALDYRISASPHWFHFVNALWAAAAAAVLALLAARLTTPRTGFVAGLLFAVHPVHVEAVANVVGRAELIAAVGYGLALLCALRSARDPRWLLGVAAAGALAIGGKEHAATLPAAVVLVGLAAHQGYRPALRAAGAAAIPMLVYFGLRPGVIGHSLLAGGLAPGFAGLGLVSRTWAMLPISLQWWRLLLVPWHLSADYSPADITVDTSLTLLHLAAIAVWIGAALLAWRLRRRVPAVGIGLLWFVLTVLPVANLVVPTEILVAERTLYLPSWGVCLALAALLVRLPWVPRVRAAVMVAIVVAFAARSIARAGVWRSDGTYEAAIQHDAPYSYRTLWYDGRAELTLGRQSRGMALLHAAVLAAPQEPQPREDLATALEDQGAWQQAVAQLRLAAAADTSRSRPWMLLPAALLQLGDTTAARDAALTALRRFGRDPDVRGPAHTVLLRSRQAIAGPPG